MMPKMKRHGAYMLWKTGTYEEIEGEMKERWNEGDTGRRIETDIFTYNELLSIQWNNSKSEKKCWKKLASANSWHKEPPKQFRWSRIIVEKRATIVNPDTNRRPTLYHVQCVRIGSFANLDFLW